MMKTIVEVSSSFTCEITRNNMQESNSMFVAKCRTEPKCRQPHALLQERDSCPIQEKLN